MKIFESSFALTCRQLLATVHVSCCSFIPVWRKEGHAYLQAKDVVWEQSIEGHLLSQKTLGSRKKKTELVTSIALAQLQAAHSLFWHYFAPPTVQWCQSACFPMKSSSACYHKCQCVLTITAGVCSGEEVNDQQATAVTTVQMDASIQKLLI